MIKMIHYNKLNEYLNRAEESTRNEEQAVKEIISEVRARGDEALFEYTKRFDGVELNAETVKVSQQEIDEGYNSVNEASLQALKRAAENIRAFHQKQKRESWLDFQPGKTLGQMMIPMSCVGIYVPGGRAAYPSSVLMNAIPAKVAGVDKIIMITPATGGKLLPLTIVAAVESGVDEIYKIGGAQAIAAVTYGTETVPKVDKIVGPGNIYVQLAKREVFGNVGIDMIAGPSEILIVADSTANPRYVAADMLSQAEHDKMARSILVTDSVELAENTVKEIEKQLTDSPREEIARASIENNGAIFIAEDINQAMEIANIIAPEHLELAVENPFNCLPRVKNAGAVFMGHYSPEPLGDYYAGPNHVLPTSGTARFFSVLSVDDFVKRTSVISYSRESLLAAADEIITLAQEEGLYAHANSIRVRTEE